MNDEISWDGYFRRIFCTQALKMVFKLQYFS